MIGNETCALCHDPYSRTDNQLRPTYSKDNLSFHPKCLTYIKDEEAIQQALIQLQETVKQIKEFERSNPGWVYKPAY